jgi:hypothetical protein
MAAGGRKVEGVVSGGKVWLVADSLADGRVQATTRCMRLWGISACAGLLGDEGVRAVGVGMRRGPDGGDCAGGAGEWPGDGMGLRRGWRRRKFVAQVAEHPGELPAGDVRKNDRGDPPVAAGKRGL